MIWQQAKKRQLIVDAILWTLLGIALFIAGAVTIENADHVGSITIEHKDLPACESPQVPRAWLIGNEIKYDCGTPAK